MFVYVCVLCENSNICDCARERGEEWLCAMVMVDDYEDNGDDDDDDDDGGVWWDVSPAIETERERTSEKVKQQCDEKPI